MPSTRRVSGGRLHCTRPRALVYLEVPDAGKSVAELAGRGVEVVATPHVIYSHTNQLLRPEGTDECMAFIRDSGSNTLDSSASYPQEPRRLRSTG